MPYNPDIHHRRSIRLRNYDYSRTGYYFVTMCTQDRMRIFGKIIDGKMILSREGIIVRDELLKTTTIRPNMIIDEWVVMPDHIHFIVMINKQDPRARVVVHTDALYSLNRPIRSLSSFIAQFKSITTKRIRSINISISSEKVWQRDYFERIIRSSEQLYFTREYIRKNPEASKERED